jgi:hypothetical protein
LATWLTFLISSSKKEICNKKDLVLNIPKKNGLKERFKKEMLGRKMRQNILFRSEKLLRQKS